MTQALNRRGFLQTAAAMTAGAAVLGIDQGVHAEDAKGAPNAEKLGWKLGCQAWTFNDVSFFEAVEKTAGLGLKYIEAFPGQKLSPQKPKVKFDVSLSDADRKEVKAFLAEKGVKLAGFGV